MCMAKGLPYHQLYDLLAEEAVLASLDVDGSLMGAIKDWLWPEHFYRDKNRWIYEACLALDAKGEELNQITICHELALRGKLEDIGGSSFLSRIVSQLPTSVYIKSYARCVVDMAQRRAKLKEAYEMAKQARTPVGLNESRSPASQQTLDKKGGIGRLPI